LADVAKKFRDVKVPTQLKQNCFCLVAYCIKLKFLLSEFQRVIFSRKMTQSIEHWRRHLFKLHYETVIKADVKTLNAFDFDVDHPKKVFN
jgi:hypothetical protein